jgi:hypothetical protein
MKVWRSREADRLPWFILKKLELNTKSPSRFASVRKAFVDRDGVWLGGGGKTLEA